ncbi:STM4015 family protein [Paenibacillus hunanensis]|uniref:STM4015 family protein n=1 Tax=Paenibacillus hunanensis TaxID=539262 RepID=UPI002A6B7E47|nr:STM4015 family protein [Paenibacillus hunanensis]WPP42467.1 STM4015 family protein [Paenibacillus hunanensis]
MTEVRLEIGYEEHEDGKTLTPLIEQLVADEEKSQALTSLIIGDWGGAYEDTPDEFLPVLIAAAPKFPNLRHIFIGDMDSEQCEISWIRQTNLGPLLSAYPQIESFYIKGGVDLELEPLEHENLQELIIISGGLSSVLLQSIQKAKLPNLRHLELYIGVDDYGFDGNLEDDILPFLYNNPFPKLVALGLKDSDLQDEIAVAAAKAPVLAQLEELDLSEGTLSDTGAEALLNSEGVRKLKRLNLNYHYMSDDMMNKLRQFSQETGITITMDEQQDLEEEWRYPSVTE